MRSVFLFGALKVIIDDASGAVLAILDRISGKNASGIFSQTYINAAGHAASAAWHSRADH